MTTIVNTGATELRNLVPAQYLPQVLSTYNQALMKTMTVAAAMSALSVFGAATIEWKNIKKDKNKKGKKRPTVERTRSAPVEKTV